MSIRPVGWDDLLQSLKDIGLGLASRSDGVIAWLSWLSPRGPVPLAANVHRGSLDRYFITLEFDSNLLTDGRSVEDATLLLRDFVRIGEALWQAHDLHEGTVSPEDTGVLLSFVESEGAEEIRRYLSPNTYARFLGTRLVRLGQIRDWLHKSSPTAEVIPLPREGLLVIWDTSPEGISRFLSLF